MTHMPATGTEHVDSPPAEDRTADTARIACPLRVLCVDDSVPIIRILRIGLESAGHKADCFTSAVDVRDRFSTDPIPYDVAVTDHEMPGMSGLELVRFLRARSFSGGILVYCSPLDAADAAAYRDAGVSLFLSKPAELSHVLSAVERAAPARR